MRTTIGCLHLYVESFAADDEILEKGSLISIFDSHLSQSVVKIATVGLALVLPTNSTEACKCQKNGSYFEINIRPGEISQSERMGQ